MAENEEVVESAKAPAEAPAGGGSKLVAIVSIVNMVATLGIVVILFLAHQKEKSKPTVDDIVAGQAKKSGGHGESKEGEHGGGGGHGGGAKEGGGHGGGHGEKSEGHSPASEEEVMIDSGKIIPLDTFTVNLTSGIGTHPRYVRINVSVELDRDVSDQEFNVKLPKVRDTIINLLNAKKAMEINASEGREILKEEIKKTINNYMSYSKVKEVYFTNFAITQ